MTENAQQQATPKQAEPTKSPEQVEAEKAIEAAKGLAIGRIVWFTLRDADMANIEDMKPVPAIVTRLSDVKPGAVTLTIFAPSRNPVSWDAEYSETPIPGRWRWPDGAKR